MIDTSLFFVYLRRSIYFGDCRYIDFENFAQPMKNGSQVVNERFFDFPEIRLSY